MFTRYLDAFTHRVFPLILRFVIKNRYATLSVAVALLMLAGGMLASGKLKLSFMPRIDSDVVTVQSNLAYGVPIERARQVQDILVRHAREVASRNGGEQILRGIYAQIGDSLSSGGPPGVHGGGSAGSHNVGVQLLLVPSGERQISGGNFAKAWRESVGDISGVETMSFSATIGASEGAALEIDLTHSETKILETAARDLARRLESYPGVTDIDNGVLLGKQQLNMQVSSAARSLGVTAFSLGRQVRAAFDGLDALRQQRGRNELKVVVRLPEQERASLKTLDDFIIFTPDGGQLPLREAGVVELGRAYTDIRRVNGQRIISVSADVDESLANAQDVAQQVIQDELPEMVSNYRGLSWALAGERKAMKESLDALKVGFALAMLAIFALLAIPFNSYVQPLIVMISIPFGIIGAGIRPLTVGL